MARKLKFEAREFYNGLCTTPYYTIAWGQEDKSPQYNKAQREKGVMPRTRLLYPTNFSGEP